MRAPPLWPWVVFLLPWEAEAVPSADTPTGGAVAVAQFPDSDAANLDVSDLVQVTCTPVIREGVVQCECYPLPPDPSGYFYATPDDGTQVKCDVDLTVYGPHLRSTCSPVADNQRFVECWAVLPRSLVTLVTSTPSTALPRYFVRRHLKFKHQIVHSCKGHCLRRDGTNTCVPDLECQRCVHDFKLFFREYAGPTPDDLCQGNV